ncbi:MAG: HlyD family efflux transporter periplasmic adaptor subunit [Sphingobacteriales bacterium]|nr:HlyD family efflux transporter periplasmic adaptor subunit [Sphingobacteriales bacterium]
MKKLKLYPKILSIAVITFFFTACKSTEPTPDAYGNFEADETIVSSRADGNLEVFNVEEGTVLNAGENVGLVDTTQLHLRKMQLIATKQGLRERLPDIQPELQVIEQQIAAQERERNRTMNLLKVGAAMPKTLDDINANIKILKSQLAARKAQLSVQTSATLSERNPIDAQIDQVKDQLAKAYIINPKKGMVLVKYAETGETVHFGSPLYRIGDVEEIILRAYISGDQLSSVKIGQRVSLRIDVSNGAYQYYNGTVEWISSEAEFTPKIIQTKDERINMVYATKIRVKNDGKIKIGMPGEVFLTPQKSE